MTDNGSAYRSTIHAFACRALGIRHLRTRPYRPRTNGKAERFIRTLLAGWAYGAIYGSSAERTAALDGWLWTYNHRRPHGSLSHKTAHRSPRRAEQPGWVLQLIWTWFVKLASTESPAHWAFCWPGGGGPGGCATRGQADIRGLVTAGPGLVWRARLYGRASRAAWSAAHSCVADALARGPDPPPRTTNVCCRPALVGSRGRPAEAGELAGDSDRDDGAALVGAAPSVASSGAIVAAVSMTSRSSPLRRRVAGARDSGHARRSAIVPGGLDQSRRACLEPDW